MTMQERSNIYKGKRLSHKCIVNVVDPDGTRMLNPRLDLRDHSPDGFEWGYNGSGPTQLALAILAHEYGDAVALEYYKGFREVVISKFAHDAWALYSSEIDEYMAHIAKIDTDGLENRRQWDEFNDH